MLRFVLIFLLALPLPVAAQEVPATDEADNGFVIGLIEDALSSDTRQIRFVGVTGALSSKATIERITVSDPSGTWLELENVAIEWTRTALLRGRLLVDELSVGRVVVSRPPIAPETAAAPATLPDAAEGGFTLPDLPVAVRIGRAAVERIEIAEPVMGRAAVVDLQATLILEDGTLDADLTMNRLDAQEGRLALQASFANETEDLSLDLDLQEPRGGVIAESLNIEGRPAIDLHLSGSGPLSDFAAELSLAADEVRLVSGNARLRDTASERGFELAISGDISPLVPAAYRGFFAGDSLVSARGGIPRAGGFRLDALLVSSAAMQLTGQGEIDATGLPEHFTLNGSIGSPDGDPTLLPVPGGDTTLQSGTLAVDLGRNGTWRAEIALSGLISGATAVTSARLDYSGTADLTGAPGTRRISGTIGGLVDGLQLPDPEAREAIGERIELAAGIAWTEAGPLTITEAGIRGNGIELGLDGTVEGGSFDGTLAARIADLSPFSGLGGRDLTGQIDIEARGQVRMLTGGFDLDFDGAATGLGIGDATINPLLAGTATLTGGLVRDRTGFAARDFRLENDLLQVHADGRYALAATDIALKARLADIGLLTGEPGGPVSLEAAATGGAADGITLDAVILAADMRLRGRQLRATRLVYEGLLQPNRDLVGQVSGSGILDGAQTALSGEIALTREAMALREFSLITDGLSMTGGIERAASGLLTGDLDLRAPDIAPAASLALVDAGGAAFARVELQPVSGRQNLRLGAEIADFTYGDIRLGSGEIDATIHDLFGLPLADGTATLSDAILGGFRARSLTATATRIEETMSVTAEADLENGTHAEVSGDLARLDPGLRLVLRTLFLEQGDIRAELQSRPALEITGDTIALSPLDMAIGAGSLTLSGVIGETLALDFTARALPVSIVNAVNPDFAAGGQIDGTAQVTGTRADPEADFRLEIADFTVAPLAATGLPPLSLRAAGRTDSARDIVDLTAALTSADGIDARIDGIVPLPGGGAEADLEIALKRFPMQVLRPLARDEGLAGTVTGEAWVTGPLDDIAARFSISGGGLTAGPLQQNGIPALSAEVSGNLTGQTVRLDTARVTGPSGLSLGASGTVPLGGPGLNIAANGTVPLALANPALARQAIQLSGDLSLSARVSGRLSSPVYSGSLATENAAFVLPLQNIRIENISTTASLTGTRLDIAEARGRFSAGGRISASGSIGLDPSSGLPADLAIRLVNAKIVQAGYIATELDGRLTVTGPLARGPLIAGEITLDGTNIVIPESFSVTAGTLLDVRHRQPPQAVRMTLARVEETSPRRDEGSGGPSVGLDIRIESPNRIFIRGWGLDTELGGSLRLRGALDDVRPVGGFNLLRGRIAILGKRLDFVEGRADFEGNLQPNVLFRTLSQVGEYQVSLVVAGRLPEPEVRFESTPELPEDEVLALLLFNQRLDELSALQAARLATAAASLRNGGRPGVTDRLRSQLGFDNLDITTDESGNAGVAAGKYVSDEIYLELETRSDGSGRSSVVYDLSESLRARGSFDSVGDSSLGIYFEKDY